MLTKSIIKWENIKCDLCGKKNLTTFLSDVRYFENDLDFNLVECKKCKLVFLNPRPIKKSIGDFYKPESYWGSDLKEMDKKYLKRDRDKIYKPLYDLIPISNERKILDIGAGIGLFLTEYKERGWFVQGVEYSKDAVKFANRSYGIELAKGDFLDIKVGDSKYDYIVMNNVLEHLHKPLETLKKVNAVLEDDGRLIIAVPNIDSLGFKIFRKNWYPLQPPIHLYHFSPFTLEKMLGKAGFTVEKINHNYTMHNKFSIFESYRSLLTGRNKNKRLEKIVNKNSKSEMKEKNNLIKDIAVMNGKIFAQVFSFIGSKIKHGESIIIYARKD